MHPIRQRFRDIRQRTAPTTCLRRVVRPNCNHHRTSFFRFVRQDLQERTPRDIQRRFSKPAASDAANVQLFVNDCAIAPDQRTAGLVVEVPPKVADPLMLFCSSLTACARRLLPFCRRATFRCARRSAACAFR
jgi:hypothetical protein